MFALCLVWAALLVANAAHAGPKETAEQHFRAGVSLQKVEDWEAAVVEFQASLALYETKSALFNLANALRALHRYAEALAALERLQQHHGDQLDAEMRRAVDALTNDLTSLTATLTLEVDHPGATLWVDGEPVGTAPLTEPLRLGVGLHRIEASLDGYSPATREVNLSSREALTVQLTLKRPAPEPAPPPPVAPPPPPLPVTPPSSPAKELREPRLRAAAWFTTGTGVAVLGAGAVTGAWALGLDRALERECLGEHCPSSRADDIARLQRLAPATDALLVVGAIATVTGVTLLVVARPQRGPSAASLRLRGGPGSATVTLGGTF